MLRAVFHARGKARAAGARRPGLTALLVAVLAAGCGEPPPAPPADVAKLPSDPEARALHCYLVLTLTIDQLAEFEGPGTRGSFRGQRGAEELLRARNRVAAELDEELLATLRHDPRPRLQALLEDFDADGDGQLSTAAEVEAFNRHVAACSRPWRIE